KQRIVGRKMDIYEQLIVSWLKEFNDISGAQVFDWLKERDQNFSMAERTVRSYVEKLRKKYELPIKTIPCYSRNTSYRASASRYGAN
ncbi:MAG: hypothetical protein ACRC7S_02575, partial [Cetobacterium sp.]